MIRLFRTVGVILWTVLIPPIIYNILSLFLPQGHPISYWVYHTWSTITLWIVGARPTVLGKENIVPNTKYLVVSNHQGNLDSPLVIHSLGVMVGFVAKRSLLVIPGIGQSIAFSGIVIPRDKRGAEKILIQFPKIDHSITIYPEGTRSKTGELGKFKPGVAKLIQQCNPVVLPIAIHGTRERWPKVTRFNPGPVAVVVGRPITDLAGLSADEIIFKLEREIHALHRSAKEACGMG